MEFKSTFETVPVQQIDLNDRRYRISTSGPSASLVASIDAHGVLTPPKIIPIKKSYTIVSGFKRIMACSQLGVKKAPAQILYPDLPLEHCINTSIAENTFTRPLNLVEQSLAIRMLDSLYKDQARLCHSATLLGLRVNLDMVDKLRTVGKMHAVLQDAVINGHIALPMALRLYRMDDESTANRITEIFSQIGLGLNRQREFLDWLVEIARRDGTSILFIIDEGPVSDILNDDDLDRKQKGRLVRQYLKEKRYPEISKAERRFSDTLKRLQLEKGVRLDAPPFFESQTYRLKIDFTDYEELVSKYRNLKGVISSNTMRSIFKSFLK
ncbi:MAG: ParB/RepB/Spo0J family partition protein [Desulfobacteraceae bacterium]|jgi:ParB family chromosome partitioning protein